MASRLKPNFIPMHMNMNSFFNTKLFQNKKNVLTNWVNYFKNKVGMNNMNYYSSAKEFFSSSIMKFRKGKINNFHIMFFTLSKLWKEMSIFLTSTFKRKKIKMKKHKTAKRIKKLRNIQKSNLKKK